MPNRSGLGGPDIEAIWEAATEPERRVLIDELRASVEAHGDHLEITVRGAPILNVTPAEVGLGSKGEDQMCRRGNRTPQRGQMPYGTMFHVFSTPPPHGVTGRRKDAG